MLYWMERNFGESGYENWKQRRSMIGVRPKNITDCKIQYVLMSFLKDLNGSKIRSLISKLERMNVTVDDGKNKQINF